MSTTNRAKSATQPSKKTHITHTLKSTTAQHNTKEANAKEAKKKSIYKQGMPV